MACPRPEPRVRSFEISVSELLGDTHISKGGYFEQRTPRRGRAAVNFAPLCLWGTDGGCEGANPWGIMHCINSACHWVRADAAGLSNFRVQDPWKFDCFPAPTPKPQKIKVSHQQQQHEQRDGRPRSPARRSILETSA